MPVSFANGSGLLNVNLNFVKTLSEIPLKKNDSFLIVGQGKDLKTLNKSYFETVLKDLEIPESWFEESLNYLCPSKEKKEDSEQAASGSSVAWLNKLVMHKISSKASRNNTPQRSHLITKVVKQAAFSENQAILVACERQYGIACACAVARAYPLYSRKTSDINKNRNVTVTFLFTDEIRNKSGLELSNDDDVRCFNTMGDSVRLSAKITDMPCAEMNTDDFLNEIKVVGKSLGIEPVVIEGEDLDKQGFGGLWNVGKAALNSPKLVVLSNIKPTAKRTIAWVGKGIVYDTGGLCIKSRVGMCGMKCDCGGAAGILGAFYSAVKLGFEDNLHAVFCLAENAVGPKAFRPDDVIKHYSGKTSETSNTDAEGRLVMADGVAYARKDLKADIILDMATLTGAQGANTGKIHAALLTNNEKWEVVAVDTGKKCGDLCFPIIYAPEILFSEFKSEIADMKNSVSKGDNASCSCAGLFVHSHLGSKYEGIWIHLDIASPAMDGDRATGYGVSILTTLFGDSSLNSTVKAVGPTVQLPLKNNLDNEDD